MSRSQTLVFAAAVGMALNLFGIFVLGWRPLTATEFLLIVFISAWAGEKRSKSDAAHVEGDKQGGGNDH